MNQTHGETLDETVRKRFESAWRDGAPQAIEDLLPDHADPRRLATLEELVHIELEFAWKQFAAQDTLSEPFREPASVESYVQRFPQLNAVDVIQRLKEQEVYVRQRYAAAAQDPALRPARPESLPADVPRRSLAREHSPQADLRSIDRYQLLEECGRGGFGVVWRAQDLKFGREVALKELSAPRVSHEQQRRFVHEAIMEARLEHPGIVPVYDLGDRSGERPFYTMKLVQGRTLATAIREFHDQPRARRTRSVEQLHLLKAFLSVTQTMEFAHARGVLHRDLKPQNIILGEYGETVILDWGLAKEHARRMDAAMPDSSAPAPPSTPSTAPPVVTLPGTIQGTPAYMSPEQATGRVREVDQRSDIYALGVMLFEILTGKLPFDADSSESMLMLVVEAEPARPRTYDAGIPPALEAICIKAMQKSPDARYGNVRALREDIERFLADVPVSAHRETIAQRLTRSARRHKSLVIGTAAVLAVAALAAGILGVVQTVQNRKLNALNAQLENSNRLEREARDAVSELADLNRDLAVRAQRQAAQAYQRQGLRLLRDGEAVTGLHSLVRSIELAPADSQAIQRVSWENLAAWSEQLPAVAARRQIPRLLVDELYREHSPLILMLAPLQERAPRGSQPDDSAWSLLDHLYGKAVLQPIKEADLSLIGAGVQPAGEWLDFHLDASAQMLQLAELDGERIPAATLLQDPETAAGDLRELARGGDLNEYDLVVRGTCHVRTLSLVTGQLEDRSVRISGCFVVRPTWTRPQVRNLQNDAAGRTYLYTDRASRELSIWSLPQGGQVGKRLPGSVGDLSSDGRVVAVLQAPRLVQLFSAADGRPVGEPIEYDTEVRLLRLSPDGSLLAAATEDKAVHVRDTRNRGLRAKLDCQLDSVGSIEIRKQNDALVLGGERNGAELWLLRRWGGSLEGLKLRASGPDSFVDREPYWTAGGQWCIVQFMDEKAVENAHRLEVWRASALAEQVVVTSLATKSPGSRIEYHEQARVVACGGMHGEFQITQDGSEWRLPFGDSIRGFSLSPDGKRLAVIDQLGVVRIWDVANRRLLGQTLEESPGTSRHLFGYRGSSRTIVAAEARSFDRISDVDLVLWSLPEERIDTIPAVAGDSRLSAVPGTDLVALQDHSVSAMAFSATGETMAILGKDARLRLRSRVTGKLLGDPLVISDEEPAAVEFSELLLAPDGKTLLTVRFASTFYDNDGEREYPYRAQLWDLTAGRPLGPPVTVEHADMNVAWNTTAQTMVAGVMPDRDDSEDVEAALYGKDLSFRIWDLKTGQPIGAPLVHRDELTSIACSPDGRVIATGSADRTARLWDAATGRPLGAPLTHYEAVHYLFFVDQGTTLLTVADGGTWRTWDVATAQPLLPPVSLPHRQQLVAAVSADGRRLVTGGDPGSIQEWDVATGLPIGPLLTVNGQVHRMVFTHLSQSVAAIVEGELRIWPRAKLQETDPLALASWVRSLTGAEFDELDALRPLTGDEMQENRKQLAERGGVAKIAPENMEVWRIASIEEPDPADWPPRIEIRPQEEAPIPRAPDDGIPAPIVDPAA